MMRWKWNKLTFSRSARPRHQKVSLEVRRERVRLLGSTGAANDVLRHLLGLQSWTEGGRCSVGPGTIPRSRKLNADGWGICRRRKLGRLGLRLRDSDYSL